MKTAICLIGLLAGCATSPVYYATHPDRKVVQVDGREISVVPRAPGQYDALGGDDGANTSTPLLKARQIRAVETVSKCKVTGAEYIPGSWILQTTVACS